MNLFEIPNTYYRLFIKNNPKFKFLFFTPRFSITRISENVFQIFVKIYQTNINTNKTVLIKEFTIDQTISDPEQYFKNLQNSNFTDIFERPAYVLEQIVAAVQEIGNTSAQSKSTTSVTVTSSSSSIFTITYNTPKKVIFTISSNWWIENIGSIVPAIYDQSIDFDQTSVTASNLNTTSSTLYQINVYAASDFSDQQGPFLIQFNFNTSSNLWVIQQS